MKLDKAVCTLGVCTDLAAELLRRTTANTTEINLCDDFESFVCDDWRQQYTLRPDQGSLSYDTVLQDRANDILHAMFEAGAAPIDSPEDRLMFGMVKGAYEACMNQTEVKRVGASPIARLMDQISKTFPVESSAYEILNSTILQDSDALQMRELLLSQLKMGWGPLVDFYVGRDDKNPLVRIVQISAPESLTLSTDYYTDSTTMTSYHEAMTKVLAAMHPSEIGRRKADQLAQQIIDFETTVSATLPAIEDLYDVTKYYNIMSIGDIGKLAPILGLDYVLKEMSPPTYSNDRVITAFPEHIQTICQILLRTSKETLQTYFMWRTIVSLIDTVLAEEIEPLRQFNNALTGRDPTAFPDRWRTCVRHVSAMDNLGWIVGRFYTREYFSEKGKQLGETLVAYVKQEYEQSIKALDWLDDSVKAVAIQKLQKLQALMGFPQSNPVNISDASAVLDYYQDVNITTSYFDNIMFLGIRANLREWKKLGTPYSPLEWGMTPQTVNAYNDISSNAIAFPAAILQVPYFHADIPSYLNFGATGWTVGHEVSHAFDNHGRDFDPDGRYGDDWWTPHTDEEFTRRSQCFVEQYANFTVEGLDGQPLHLNGEQTLGENIADAGGIDTAFLAWQQHRKDFPEEDADLPGLEKWTHEQLYFVAFANSWCSIQRRESLINQVYGDVHAPAKFRIKGSLENSKYFKEHFNCPVKEPKCKIW